MPNGLSLTGVTVAWGPKIFKKSGRRWPIARRSLGGEGRVVRQLDVQDLQRRLDADGPKHLRSGPRGVGSDSGGRQGVEVPPQRLDPPLPVGATQELRAQQSVGSGKRDHLPEPSQELILLLGEYNCADLAHHPDTRAALAHDAI